MQSWPVVIAAAFMIAAVDAFQLSTTQLRTQSHFTLTRRSPALRAPSPGSVRCSVAQCDRARAAFSLMCRTPADWQPC
jgi:hypothetical protein